MYPCLKQLNPVVSKRAILHNKIIKTLELNDLKKEVRKEVLNLRNSMDLKTVDRKSLGIFENLVGTDMYKKSRNLFTYMSFQNEAKTDRIVDWSIKNHKNIYIPLCNTLIKEIIVCKMDSWDELEPSKFGILEPKIESIKIADRNLIDLAIVPGAVFDIKGNRIGYGAGYYDKFFASLDNDICKIGICYSFQLMDSIDVSSYDIPMDYIITENEVIKCA